MSFTLSFSAALAMAQINCILVLFEPDSEGIGPFSQMGVPRQETFTIASSCAQHVGPASKYGQSLLNPLDVGWAKVDIVDPGLDASASLGK